MTTIHFLGSDCFSTEDYIITSSGNRISRTATIIKPQSLEIPSGRVIIKESIEINCENAPVIINKYTMICESTKLIPSTTLATNDSLPKYIPMTIGSHCYVGRHCKIESAIIGICCYISDNCVIFPRCILKDYVYIEANSVVPSDMVIPPFSIVSGTPAKIIGELPESITTLGFQNAIDRYRNFKPLP